MERGDLAGATVGQYRIDTLIGRGGMGEVYRAYDQTLGRQVALKVLPPALVTNEDSLTRFVQEARSASALNHPNVVSIYQIGREVPSRSGATAGAEPAVDYIAMELVPGETLRAVFERQRPEIKRTLDYLAQAADALAAAHAAGIVHRDFKPDNVMIADRGYIKVLDFGLAKPSVTTLLEHADTQRTALGTAPGAILGTVGYMSPEQGEGRQADHRSDVFSFGCVLYESTTGIRAFQGTSSVDTLHRIIHAEPDPVLTHAPGAPAELQRIIRKCLAKDPDARYQSMSDVALDLRALRRELDSGQSAVASSTNICAVATKGSRAWLWVAAAAAAALMIVAAGVVTWRAQQTATTATTTAPPMRVQRLTGSGGVIDGAISPDGKYLAYVESLGGDQSLWLRQLTGTQPLQLVAPARVGFWGVRFSPDSSSIYYSIKGPAHTSGQLFTIPLLGGTPRPILAGIDSAISWAPDARRFTYVRADFPTAGSSALMIASIDGAQPRALATRHPPLFFAPVFFTAPAWSPDGQRIAVPLRNAESREAHTDLVDVATGVETLMPTGFRGLGYTAWLPDGSGIVSIALPLELLPGQGGGRIYLQPYPSGSPRQLTSDLVDYRTVSVTADGKSLMTIGSDVSPTLWEIPLDRTAEPRRLNSVRYDGFRGLVTLPDQRLLFTTLIDDTPQLAIMHADGGNKQMVTSEGLSAWPEVTADGRTIIFVGRRGDDLGIFRMDIDGTNTRLLAPVGDASHLDLAPDQRTLFFTSAAQGGSSTWRIPIDGGVPTLVTAAIDRASVSPDGRLLAGISRAEGGLSLNVMRLSDGETIHRFTGHPMVLQGGGVHWTKDGSGVLFTTAERSNLWLQPLNGEPAQRVTQFSDQTLFRIAAPTDSRRVFASRGGQMRDAFLITDFR